VQNTGRGGLGLLKPAIPAGATQSGKADDLEKMMEAQYGR
jgi:hypothetical protein